MTMTSRHKTTLTSKIILNYANFMFIYVKTLASKHKNDFDLKKIFKKIMFIYVNLLRIKTHGVTWQKLG